MPGPKSKVSRMKKGMRRSHDKVKQTATQICPTTNEIKRPHRAHLSSDGAYYHNGKQISAAKSKS